ncbi:retinal guanylyl cyclase 1-like isoform X2 [Babylonia areolata]|uniref:retinal guanylyl cyclase 1-like isoform X2 n=1 Tax=Babylonia areolata TaxID=304850 RepID=UPI003FD0D13A
MASYLEKKYLGESYLQLFKQYVDGSTELDDRYIGSDLQDTIENMRHTIMCNVRSDPDVQMGQWWFDNMTDYINILKATQDHIAGHIVSGLEAEIQQQWNSLVASICIMSGAVVLLFLVIISVHRLTKRLQSFAVTLQEKTVALNIERKRSENLLNELMPPNVARKLMANQPVEPEAFQAVTIFFSDIVGFTSISSKSSPLQVIDMLNMLYKTFDETLDLYQVYKVETIGDAYMIASGLPVRNEEGHAAEMGELALELRDTICNMVVPHIPDHPIRVRIGLNSGSVVSGVVGYKMPRYCLFGDTVNVASRMESSGVPAKIQISGSTFQELSRHEGFVMEQRGEGKGTMLTYFLVGRTTFVPRRSKDPDSMGG